MQNMLVTGGCGFIGSNFVRFLLEEAGFEGRVVNFDKLTYAADPEGLADVAARFPERYVLVHADICDRAAVRDAFRTYAIDAVCHFAAESHVDRSIDDPAPEVRRLVNPHEYHVDLSPELWELRRRCIEQAAAHPTAQGANLWETLARRIPV